MNKFQQYSLFFCVLIMGGGLLSGCAKQPQAHETAPQSLETEQIIDEPCPLEPVADANMGDDSLEPTMFKDGKQLWARSYLWQKPPELVVEKWISEEPQIEGKCVLIEFWATWCPPCRKSITLLNQLHEKFQDRLVVIGISHESEETIRDFDNPKPNFYSAIDTQSRTKDEMAVRGIPHVIILEPEGYVVWEGFPYQKGYELTEELVASILDIAFETEP